MKALISYRFFDKHSRKEGFGHEYCKLGRLDQANLEDALVRITQSVGRKVNANPAIRMPYPEVVILNVVKLEG